MTRIRLKYVHVFEDRHGKWWHYFRRAGFKQVRLPGLPGSQEFMEAYPNSSGDIVVTRNPAGEVDVQGKGLAGNLKLYMAGTGDKNLSQLSSDVLTWAEGEASYQQSILARPPETVDRLVEPKELAEKARFFLEEQGEARVTWAKVMIANEIENLVPQKPVNRFNESVTGPRTR